MQSTRQVNGRKSFYITKTDMTPFKYKYKPENAYNFCLKHRDSVSLVEDSQKRTRIKREAKFRIGRV